MAILNLYLNQFRDANTQFIGYLGFGDSPLFEKPPFSTVWEQINELGLISQTAGGVTRGPEFDKNKFAQALQKLQELLTK